MLIREQVRKRQAVTARASSAAAAGAVVAGGGMAPLGICRYSAESMVDRYYARMYAADMLGVSGHDHYVFMHSNKLCVVGLAAHNRALAEGGGVRSVSFTIKGRDLTDAKPSGKRKRGAMWLNPRGALCQITLNSGAVVTVHW